MFVGRADQARPLYDKHRGEKTYGGRTWEAAAREGFANLRAKGLTGPLMDEVERHSPRRELTPLPGRRRGAHIGWHVATSP